MTFDIRAGRGGGVQNGQKTSDVTNGRLEENRYNIIHMHNFLGINIGEQFNKISTLILYWTDFTAFIRALPTHYFKHLRIEEKQPQLSGNNNHYPAIFALPLYFHCFHW